MSASFAVVTLSRSVGSSRSKRWKGLVVVEVRLRARSRCARCVPTSRARGWKRRIARACWDKVGEETWRSGSKGLLVLQQYTTDRLRVYQRICIFIGITSLRLQRRETVIVLQLEVGRHLLRRASFAVTASESKLLHHGYRVVRELTEVAREAIALQPKLANMVLKSVRKATISTSTVP